MAKTKCRNYSSSPFFTGLHILRDKMPEVIKQISSPITCWKNYMKNDNKRLAAKALNCSISIK